MIADKPSAEHIHEYFTKVNRTESQNNEKQALIPKGSMAIPNKNGTAPGIYIQTNNAKIIAMFPGPPNELIPMYEDFVKDRLKALTKKAYSEKYYMLSGVGEAHMEQILRKEIPTNDNYTLNTYITQSGIRLRAVASASDNKTAQDMINANDAKIRSLFSEWLYSESKCEIWESVAKKLIENNITISAAESCTGGLFASLLTKTSGVSKIFSGSLVTYSNAAKAELLSVNQETLDEFGAVSEPTAKEMAANIRKIFNSDIGVGITGFADPLSLNENEPAGCVFICINIKGISKVVRNIYIGSRTSIQMKSAIAAFKIINDMLK